MGRENKLRFRLKGKPDLSDYKAADWYTEATKLIKELYGENWELFIGLLAATSPRQSVKRNWRMSDKILKAYLDRANNPEKFADILGRCMPAQLINVIRVLQGRPIKGPKVSRFQQNLLGNLSDVTIDVWICKAYNIPHKSLTELQYKKLERLIKLQAKRAGYLPAEYQAIIWTMIRRLSGLKTKSFTKVYNEIFCEQPCFDFMKED